MTAIAEHAAKADAPPRRSLAFVHRPVLDVALAFAWVPFTVVAHYLQRPEISASTLTAFVSAVFLLSFAHQPLTIALVYGDAEQFRLRRAVFTWTPLILASAVVFGFYVSFTLMAIIGGLWNAEHTLMQRYGVTRIYGRKVGQSDGGLEKAMLFSWLALALVWAAADLGLPARLGSLEIGRNNRAAFDALVALQPYAALLVVPVVLTVLGLIAAWGWREWHRPTVNPAKWIYLGSTAALFAAILIDPVAGVMGYVGSHAVEYFVIVHQSLGRRYDDPTQDGGAVLGRVVRAPTGRIGFLVVYVGLVTVLVSLLARLGSPLAYFVVFFTLGGMHVFYDGFIWKLRRPAVARSFAIAEPHT
jgi:hypothetical protein